MKTEINKLYYTKLSDIEQIKFINECEKNNVNIEEEVIKQPVDREYPYIYFEVDENGKGVLGTCDGNADDPEDDILVSKTKFKELVRNHKNPIEIVLNEQYKAIICSDGVKVGCQKFSFNIIKELAKAAKIKL